MQRFSNISIRKKLIIIQASTALLALVICCTIFVINGVQTFKASTQKKMYSIARIVGANAVSPLQFMDQDAAAGILHKLNQESDIHDAIVLDKKGAIFARYSRDTTASPDVAALQLGHDTGDHLTSRFSGNTLIVNYGIYNDNDRIGTLIINAEMTDLNRMLRSYIIVAFLVLFAGLLAALIISYILQRTISSRLLSLVIKTKEVADTGNYSIRVSTEDEDEIGILSKEFNMLMVQIDNMEKSLKEANAELEKRVEQRTAELESANKELESFSYTVSHDLKAPLRAINGFTEILVKKYGAALDDKGKEVAGVIVANARKMGQLIEDLLEFSRLGRREITMNQVNMDEVVDQVLIEARNAYPGRDIEVKREKLPPAMGDQNLLVQVWTNLISNAFKYTGHKEHAVISIGCTIKNNEEIYYVKDNGAGFDMKYADKLFRVFQRLHGANEFEGTGVGLAIINRIITRHGGRVWAEGKVEEGAAFYFSLPLQGTPVVPSTSKT